MTQVSDARATPPPVSDDDEDSAQGAVECPGGSGGHSVHPGACLHTRREGQAGPVVTKRTTSVAATLRLTRARHDAHACLCRRTSHMQPLGAPLLLQLSFDPFGAHPCHTPHTPPSTQAQASSTQLSSQNTQLQFELQEKDQAVREANQRSSDIDAQLQLMKAKLDRINSAMSGEVGRKRRALQELTVR
ncbi:MAG: hypothetical protein WDW38_007590 [Sanguina aurantia]